MSDTLRIASYNLQNLFLGDGGELQRSQQSLKALVRMLELLHADVLALQEVGGQEALETLNEQLQDPYPFVFCIEGNSHRGIHLGYLSRFPLALESARTLALSDAAGRPLVAYRDAEAAAARQLEPLRFQRDVLTAVAKIDGVELCLLNAHLKSRVLVDWQVLESDVIRSAELLALCRLAREAARCCPTILLGDFNERWSNELMAPLRGLNWIDTQRWETSRSAGARTRVPGTYWKKRRTRLDYLLVEPGLEAALVPGSARTHGGALGQRASDHYPVSVDLALSFVQRNR